MHRLSIIVAGTFLLLGCSKPERSPAPAPSGAAAPQGLPPGGAGGGVPGQPGIHGGGGDPHAGMNMGGGGDPHAGMNMGGGGGDPHGGGGGGMGGTMSPTPGPLDPNTVIEGTIEASPGLAAQIKPGDVLFLSIKAVDPTTGEIRRGPLAVDKLVVDKLPQTFVLSNQNQMTPGTQITGQIAVTVRLDRDSDAMTRQPGDLEGVVKTTPPQKGLKVVIDTAVE